MDNHLDTLSPLSPSDAETFAWVNEGPAFKVMSALEAAKSGASRYVGGCVRDSLVGVTPKDIDIATTLMPDEVVEALKDAGLKSAPTGIEHGTITGIADYIGVEVTTLRADVSTDGRRATVAFTDDWSMDAKRRDFTMNALYLTQDKMLFDPVGGVDDLKAGRVKFIGDAGQRIREDYLRIMRFFRFSARFAATFDETGLTACQDLRGGMKALSAERIGDELVKILNLPTAINAITAMNTSGVLSQVWPETAALDAFSRLKQFDKEAAAPLGLAALFGARDRSSDGKTIDTALRLSKAQADRRKLAIKNALKILPDISEKDACAVLYRIGDDGWRDAVMLAAANGEGSLEQWQQWLDLSSRWVIPVFSIGGQNILDAGIEQGPKVAKLLTAAETQWIEEGFPGAGRAQQILQSLIETGRYS